MNAAATLKRLLLVAALCVAMLSLSTGVFAQDDPVQLGPLPEPTESGMAPVNDI